MERAYTGPPVDDEEKKAGVVEERDVVQAKRSSSAE